MDFEGWGMRVTVIRREYATHEISARVFGTAGRPADVRRAGWRGWKTQKPDG
jgi:hypothetical protein